MTSSWDLSGGFPVGVGLASKASAAPRGSPRAPPSHTWADQRNHGSAGAARRASPLHHFLLPPPGTATGRPAPGSSTVLRSCRQPAGSSRRDHSQRGSRGVAGHGNWLTATDQRPSEPCGHPAPSARGARERRRSPAAPLGLPARVVLLSQRHAPLPAPRSGSSTGLELGVGVGGASQFPAFLCSGAGGSLAWEATGRILKESPAPRSHGLKEQTSRAESWHQHRHCQHRPSAPRSRLAAGTVYMLLPLGTRRAASLLCPPH